MSDDIKTEAVTASVQSRRAFVKTAAKVAVTAPAAALLLNASVKPAKAQEVYADTGNPFDDAQLGDDQGADDFRGFGDFGF